MSPKNFSPQSRSFSQTVHFEQFCTGQFHPFGLWSKTPSDRLLWLFENWFYHLVSCYWVKKSSRSPRIIHRKYLISQLLWFASSFTRFFISPMTFLYFNFCHCFEIRKLSSLQNIRDLRTSLINRGQQSEPKWPELKSMILKWFKDLMIYWAWA